MCGPKAPLIGVFFIILLAISQSVYAKVNMFDESEAIAPLEIAGEEGVLPDVDVEEIVPEEIPLDLSEEQIADLKGLEELLASGEISQEEYDVRKETILATTKNQNSFSLLTTPGANPKSQTLGKYISPVVSIIDGSLNYEYPIVVPPGRAGLTPDLKLVYDSNNRSQSSIIGIGWSLDIPYIQRVNKKGTDKIYTEDYFISSIGGELIDQGNGIFTPRTENGSFLKYQYEDDAWIVTDKKGTQYKFGVTSNGRQDNPDNASQIFSWMLEEVVDINGNTISYTYFKDQGQIYPDTISYNQTGIFTVEFSRTSRPHINISHIPAFKVITAYRISNIKVHVGGILTTKYTISSNDNLVQSVLVEGYRETQTFSLPPVQFEYATDEGSKEWSYNSNFTLPTDPATGKVLVLDYNNSAYYGNSFKDINGDGLLDIVRWTQNQPNGYASSISGNQIFLNTGSGFELKPGFLLPTDAAGKVFVLDFNCPNSTSDPNCPTSTYYGNSFMDINGDGLLDIVRWWAGRQNGEVSSDLRSGNQVFINTGESFILDSNFLLPTNADGKVLVLDYNYIDRYGNSFKDINGDGRPDIVRWDANQPNGYSNPNYTSGNQVFINTGESFVLDSNFLLPTNPTNGKVLTLEYRYSNNTTNFYGNSFMDINGDGFLDIMRWKGGELNGYYSSPLNNSGNQVFINTGESFVLDASFLLPTASNGRVLALDSKYGAVSTFYSNSFKDINGDGLVDVIRWLANQPNGYSNPNYTSGNQVFINTGESFVLDADFLLPTDSNNLVLTLDYNYSNTYGNLFKDVNGDGFPDIVRWDTNQSNGGTYNYLRGNQVFINTGENFVLDPNFLLPTASNGKVLTLDYTVCKFPQVCTSVPSSFNGNAFLDINSDGIIDVVRWDNSQFNSSPTNPLKGNQVILGEVGRKEITKITSSSGGTNTFSFKGIREFRNSSGVGVNAEIPEGYEPFVVATHTTNDNHGNIGTTTYEYHGAKYYHLYDNPFDKRITGFDEVTKINPDGSRVITKYHQANGETGNEPDDSYAKIGKVYEETVEDSAGNLFSRIRTNYVENSLGNNTKSIQVSSQLSQIYDGDNIHKDTAEEYDYDDFGNLIQNISWGEVLGNSDGSFVDIGTDKLTENISYAIDTNDNYLVGFPSGDIVLNQAGIKTRESKMYYDGLVFGSVSIGNQTKQESWKGDAIYVNTQKTYNFFGLSTNSTDERGIITNYTYDTYNLYPTIITDPLNHTTQFLYDYSSGKVKQVTDQNGFVYQTVFDGFGRVLQEEIPDLVAPHSPVVKTEYLYTDTPLATSVKKMDYLDDFNNVETYQYFDGFGRLIQERTEGEGVNNFNIRDLKYNNLGTLEKESLKYLGTGSAKTVPTTITTLYINYVYDILGRPITTTNSVGTTHVSYDDWKTVSTDANGKIKNYYKDAYGNLVKVEEVNNGSVYVTNYEWNENKNLTKITDALGNIRSFTYDKLGRRLTAGDLHAPLDLTFGTWSYVYDDVGNMIQSTSPEGKIVNYTYDAINRVLTEDYLGVVGVEIAYLYDSCLWGIGKLCFVSITNGSNTSYIYNSNGSVASENKIIDGITYTTSSTYDRVGNVLNIIYPDNAEVKYTYNTAGFLEKVERKENGGALTGVISNFDYSPMGQMTTKVSANGVTTTNTYDTTKLYRLVNKKTVNALQNKFQDLTYTYDNIGNITKIVDASNTATAKTTNYVYDDLYRLILTTVTSTVNGQNYIQTTAYDAIGNIINKSDQGSYYYSGNIGENYANPHANTFISYPTHYSTYTYDKNGNLTKKTSTTSAVLNGSVDGNGSYTTAWYESSATGSQQLQYGSLPLLPYTLTGLLPNTKYSFRVVAQNEAGTTYGDWMKFTTMGGQAPVIFSATVSPGSTSAKLDGSVNGSGFSTNAWYESSATGSQKLGFVHLNDCNNTVILPSYSLIKLKKDSTYKFRVVAQNEAGITYGSWITFRTKGGGIISQEDEPPEILSATATPNTPFSVFNTVNYTWNYRNELIGVSSLANNATYKYDNGGNRVKATVGKSGGVATYYPSKFYNISGTTKNKYIYAGNTLVATIKTIGTTVTPTYVHTDHLDSTNVVSNVSGAVDQAIDYYPFGSQRLCGGTTCDANKKYIGQYHDNDTALDYLNARYYDSYRGQFVSIDPMFWNPEKFLSDPQQLNSYSYARNNPIVYQDPNGEYIESFIDVGFILYDLYDLAKVYVEGGDTKEQLSYLGLDFAGLAIPGATGLGLAGRTAAKAAKVAKVANVTSDGVKAAKKVDNIVNGANILKKTDKAIDLAEHNRQITEYGKGGVKYLENGRTRYYGEIQKASKEGTMAGRRMVREWDSATGLKRTWHETLDNNDIVRQIRIGENPKIHYMFDEFGKLQGRW